jgi:hypothetical protein
MRIIERWKNAAELEHEARVRLYLADSRGFAHYAVAWYLRARVEREAIAAARSAYEC